MALTNKEKVGRGLDVLHRGLLPVVDERMTAAAQGGDWVKLLEARDSHKYGTPKTYSRDDVRFLLRVLTEEWRAFDLTRAHSALATELREVGNRWAHDATLSSDDVYRALDTTERLLIALGQPSLAEDVATMRRDHQRQVYEDQARRRAKAPTTVVVPGTQAGTAIKPWRQILTPHADVASGTFHAAEFAADLHQVANGAPQSVEYTDPREFFARTYLTGGLAELLERALRRVVAGDAGASPVMNLQTQFGGGKTHSMLALYHLFSGVSTADLPQDVQDIVARVFPDRAITGADDPLRAVAVRRAVLVGTHLSPSQPRIMPDGTELRTLWGELAWQLGGRAAYDRIATADATGIPPGDVLADVVREHGPAIILIDEWVAYARLLVGKEGLPGGDFSAQFTFAQHLTELVRAIPGVMLVVSIPASDNIDAGGAGSALEVGGPGGREALERLQHVVGRTADDWRPANATESFEIVKRRLFTEPDATSRADIAAVARQYSDFYREHTGEFPREVTSDEYQHRLRVAYPIHPELFDRLYQDWSTLEKFQRTRGVLRLMSKVIHALWQAGDASPLITPGTLPLHVPEVFSEITKYLPDNWKPVVDSDVDGDDSLPARIDAERPSFGQRALTRRIARAVLFGSAPTLGTAHKGLEKPRVWLGVAVPGDTLGHFGDALEMLGQRATYFYGESGRFWYDTTASITRQATDRADRLREVPDEVWAEVVRRLSVAQRQPRGLFAAVHVAPLDPGDVPDTDEARLVLVHPTLTWGKESSRAREFAEELLKRAGSGQRVRRNMVVLVAADGARIDELEAATRDYLAWTSIVRDSEALDLRPQQRSQAERRAEQADSTVTSRLWGAYSALLTPVAHDPAAPATISYQRVSEGSASLAERVSEKLRRAGELTGSYATVNVRLALDGLLSSMWADGVVRFGDLWDAWTRYPYLDRLRDRSVLEQAVLDVAGVFQWTSDGFALARGRHDDGRLAGLWLPGDQPEPSNVADDTLIVKPDLAIAERRAETTDVASTPEAAPGAVDAPPAHTPEDAPWQPGTPRREPGPVPTPQPADAPRRFFGVKTLNPQRYAADFANLTQEVIQHLAVVDGVELEVRIEISARAPHGFSEQQVRTVRENATQLRFEQSGFERD